MLKMRSLSSEMVHQLVQRQTTTANVNTFEALVKLEKATKLDQFTNIHLQYPVKCAN